jgi:hypothetical protein
LFVLSAFDYPAYDYAATAELSNLDLEGVEAPALA